MARDPSAPDRFLERCLLLDLETTRAPEGSGPPRILALGAALGPGGPEVTRQGRFDLAAALEELDELAAGADFLLGHNLLDHDLRVLEKVAPDLALHHLPVVDTLFLSPLAFPENPYHHLVKDYKLVRQELNNPLADARLAARVFRDQWVRLAQRAEREPGELAFYATCFASVPEGRGIAEALSTIGGEAPLSVPEAAELLLHRLAHRVCRRALRQLALDGFRPTPPWAYAVAWLQVAGGSSVLPPWVRYRHGQVIEILAELREHPCHEAGCAFCRTSHDPEAQLQRFFGFPAFRPRPATPDGKSLQREIVTAGLEGRPHLAILATGAGKSICFQLPALVRHQRRGLLTLVISPLQALMKDQIDHLNAATGASSAAALYGLLSPPERGRVLEKVRLGDVAILYIAPEQLRNRSFLRAVRSREIAAWVFDEAHCLSKWGHDFRPDYLYAARFLRELATSQGVSPPPVMAFTATAKASVRQEILTHFAEELGQELQVFEGPVEREELGFRVEEIRAAEKIARIRDLLQATLGELPDASAVVYFSSRRGAARGAELLQQQGIASGVFHGGLPAPEKREVLDDFVSGRLPVVCATNAFGMGIDKSDVRLVVHADIPGSLESYLQEAGRAGRDRQPAECVLLFDPEDLEHQFKLQAGSHLSRRDIAQILRAVRNARDKARRARTRREQTGRSAPDPSLVCLTTAELLRDHGAETEFSRDDWQADTKVKTAIAWLERAGFLERELNRTHVFQGKLSVDSLAAGRREIDRLAPTLGLRNADRRRWTAILAALIHTDPDRGLTADEIAELPDVRWEPTPGDRDHPSQRVLRILNTMAEVGLLKSGLQLTATLHLGGAKSSRRAFASLCALDKALLDLLAETEPDAEAGDWLELSLRLVNQRLIDRGFSQSNPTLLRKLLQGLAESGGTGRGLLEWSYRSRFRYRLRLRSPWGDLHDAAERRRALGQLALDRLLAAVPSGTRGRVLVELGLEDLTDTIRRDLVLRTQIDDFVAAAEQGLMFLHELGVIQLQSGLAVFRQAMTLRLRGEAKGRRYGSRDYEALDQHFSERTFQIHVMARYARLGIEAIQGALAFVQDYFQLARDSLEQRYFSGEEATLARATDEASFLRIVESLGDPAQMALVTAPPERNLLVMAGPGSGKTRVVVHRCAYLLRVARIPARRIAVLCFNRNAALELRRRLKALVGDDCRGVTVSTYHGLAMRLTGTSFATLAEASTRSLEPPNFQRLIEDAVDLLREDTSRAGLTADEIREEIASSYSHLLVDEYQDINEAQYRLVSALSGRTESDRDRRLSLLAVGDDDQNIYSFTGADVGFIRRFQDDYEAEVAYLVENYRSTGHIIAAANSLIARDPHRMKAEHPGEICSLKRQDPPGGPWTTRDPETEGRVVIREVPDRETQAAAVAEELFHMKHLHPELEWHQVGVLARQHDVLQPVRAVLEHRGIPVAWSHSSGSLPPLHRIREITRVLDTLAASRRELVSPAHLLAASAAAPENPWFFLLDELIREWVVQSGEGPAPAGSILEFLYEALAERGRAASTGTGVHLLTVHSAKGLEFPGVLLLDGGWRHGPNRSGRDGMEEERRLYYVGMTRAKERLVLFESGVRPNPHSASLGGPAIHRSRARPSPIPSSIAGRRFVLLGLRDLYLSFAGRRPEGDPIHRRLASLETHRSVQLASRNGQVVVLDGTGQVVAALSSASAESWSQRLEQIESARVVAMVRWRAEDSDAAYRRQLRCDRWEVPVLELTLRPSKR